MTRKAPREGDMRRKRTRKDRDRGMKRCRPPGCFSSLRPGKKHRAPPRGGRGGGVVCLGAASARGRIRLHRGKESLEEPYSFVNEQVGGSGGQDFFLWWGNTWQTLGLSLRRKSISVLTRPGKHLDKESLHLPLPPCKTLASRGGGDPLKLG